jgi:beta-glucanase (GH16 family)
MSPTPKAHARRFTAALAATAVILPLALTASPASAAETISVLADFEGGASSGFFSYGAAGFGTVPIEPGTPEAKPGQTEPTTVISYGWNVTVDPFFGGVGENFPAARDLSAFDGVRFALNGSGNGSALQFELFDGGANSDSSERFDVTIVDDVAGWRVIDLPWAAFSRATDFQPGGAPNDGLTLTSVWGYALPAASGSNTVRVDDIVAYADEALAPTASISPATLGVIEGRTATLTVSLTVAPTETVSVDVATAVGSASADDFTAVATTLEFAAGVTSRTIDLVTTDDSVEEGDETVTVQLSNPVGVLLGSSTSSTVSILDDDGAVVGPPTGRTLLIDDHEAPLTTGADGTVPLGWFAAQDPSSTVAFEATEAPPAPVPGAAGDNTVLRADANVVSFGVVVRNFANEAADTWTTQDWSSYEGIGFWMLGTGSGTDLFFDLLDNRNPDSTRDDAERYVASFEDDFVGWKFLTFDFADFSRKEIGNGAPADGLTLTEMHGYAFGVLRTTGTQSFYYDDVLLYGEAAPIPLQVSFDRAGYEVTEGDDAITTVRLTRVAETDVTVDWSAFSTSARTRTEDLPATDGEDFTAASGSVTIPAGEREATISVETLQNAKFEVDETFVVALENPVGAEFGVVRTAAVSIQDDDEKIAGLVDDMESFPWLIDTARGTSIETRDAAGAYPGADVDETVLDIAFRGNAGITRPIEGGQDWSAADGLSFWVNSSKPNQRITVGIADNGAPDAGPDSWVPVWSDEFDGAAGEPANPDNWTYETGGWGWGNDELQYYTDSTDNAALDGEGNLVITVEEIDPATTDLECWYGPCEYTSARLISENKQEFEYGRIESRVQVPQGSGIWPAVWTLGNDFREVGWPRTGEIDIMEFVGRLPNEIFGTIHGPGYSGGQSFGGIYDFGTPVYDDWHTFSVEWTPEKIDWYVDGIQYHTASPADIAPNEWVFDHPFTLLTNVAVGGNFGGALGDDLQFPQSLTVDYIRVFQAPDTAERFEATVVVDGTGWQQVTVPFEQFQRAAKQPAGAPDDGLTLTDVQGYSLGLKGVGTISIDRVLVE